MYKVTATVSHPKAHKVLLEGVFISKDSLGITDADIIRNQCISVVKKNLVSEVPIEEVDIKIHYRKMNLDFIVVEDKE